MDPTRRHLIDRMLLLYREFSSSVNDVARRQVPDELLQNRVLYVLARLAADGAQRPRDLLPSSRVTSGGLSNLLGRMEAAGLVERRTGVDDDLRAVIVELTPAGRELESLVGAAVVRGLTLADSTIKELILLLVEAGASATPTELPTAASPATRVTLGMVELTMQILEAVSLGDGVETTDANSTLVLAALDHLGETRPRFLADLLDITSGGASRLIDRLEQAGHVTRHRDEIDTDHRGVVVQITPQGVALLEKMLAGAEPHLDDLLGLLRAVWVEVHGADPAID